MDASLIAVEYSRSWGEILQKKIPKQLDVFFIAWLNEHKDLFHSWGIYLSTSEPGPPDCVACLVAQVTVDVKGTDQDALRAACEQGIYELNEAVWKSGDSRYIYFRNRLNADLEKQKASPKPAIAIETVSQRDFEELVKRARQGRAA